MRTAIVIGATGLVGNELVKLLIADNRFSDIIVFVRREMSLKHPKVTEHIIDFRQIDSWKNLVEGDVLFSALGTTIKQAGSKAAQYEIDYTYQYQFAQAAAENKVPVYALVSSASASPDSRLFYSRIKGELERDVKQLGFSSINIFQPSLLVGDRKKERFGEKLGYKVLKVINALGLFKKYRPIHGKIVAMGMLKSALKAQYGSRTYILDDIFTLADK